MSIDIHCRPKHPPSNQIYWLSQFLFLEMCLIFVYLIWFSDCRRCTQARYNQHYLTIQDNIYTTGCEDLNNWDWNWVRLNIRYLHKWTLDIYTLDIYTSEQDPREWGWSSSPAPCWLPACWWRGWPPCAATSSRRPPPTTSRWDNISRDGEHCAIYTHYYMLSSSRRFIFR